MKKLLLLIAVLMTSSMLFSQSIMTTWESLPTAAFPMISLNGAPTDMEIVSHIKVTNVGSAPIRVKVAREIIYQVDSTDHQFCWAGACFSSGTDTSANDLNMAPGESSDEFSGHLKPEGTFGISTIKYTFFEMDNPSNAVSVTILYNSLFELTCEAGDSVSPHARMISGTPDVVSQGKIDVHNYSPMPLNLVAFKQPFTIVENTTNWFFFNGVEYPFGTDTSGVVTIPGSTTDESFEFYYNADGHPGVSQMIYVFNDPTIPGNYAIYMIGYSDNTGISDDILANTTFSPAYPNPADNFVSFNYDIPNEVKQADLLITNLLGAVVYEGSLQGLTGTKRIDVSNLTEGIYFATLKLDNEIAISQKILVQ